MLAHIAEHVSDPPPMHCAGIGPSTILLCMPSMLASRHTSWLSALPRWRRPPPRPACRWPAVRRIRGRTAAARGGSSRRHRCRRCSCFGRSRQRFRCCSVHLLLLPPSSGLGAAVVILLLATRVFCYCSMSVTNGRCTTFAAICGSVSMTFATVLPRARLQSQVGKTCSIIHTR
jgi:hypothetical protein